MTAKPTDAERIRVLEEALELLLSYEKGGTPPRSVPRSLAVDHARATLSSSRESGS